MRVDSAFLIFREVEIWGVILTGLFPVAWSATRIEIQIFLPYIGLRSYKISPDTLQLCESCLALRGFRFSERGGRGGLREEVVGVTCRVNTLFSLILSCITCVDRGFRPS